MNTQWRTFLEQGRAASAAEQVAHFDQLAIESRLALTGNVGCNLLQEGLIVASGVDSAAFLQGQLTCDVRQVTPERSLISAYCNPKGRILACLRLFQREDSYYLALPNLLVEPTLIRLRKYLMRAKTVLEADNDRLERIGIAGPAVAQLLSQCLAESISGMAAGAVVHSKNITVIRLNGLLPRFVLYGTAPELAAIWNTLGSELTPVGTASWRLLRILAGTPAVYPETVEAFVPQMLNLQLLDGISFQKGCYTGQEIVARTHYLGKLKRRMYLALVDSPTPPRPGDPLFSPQTNASQSAGQLVDVAIHPDGSYAVLAVALIECAEGGILQLGNTEGPLLRMQPLPYAFSETR